VDRPRPARPDARSGPLTPDRPRGPRDSGAGLPDLSGRLTMRRAATAVFSAVAATVVPARTARPVLLDGMAGDQHRLPLVVFATTLTQRGASCRSLGADLPSTALATAIRRTAPHRTGGGAAAVVTAEIHRRPAGPAIATAHAPRISQLRRRPRLGGDGTPAASDGSSRSSRPPTRSRRRHSVTVSPAQEPSWRGQVPQGRSRSPGTSRVSGTNRSIVNTANANPHLHRSAMQKGHE
jgi:hypothetical protein